MEGFKDDGKIIVSVMRGRIGKLNLYSTLCGLGVIAIKNIRTK